MEMSRATYEDVLESVQNLLHKRDFLKHLVLQFPHIPKETLQSIHSQHYQLATKQTHNSHRKQDAVKTYHERYWKLRNSGDDDRDLLLKMADEVRLSPTLFARIILEQAIVEERVQSLSDSKSSIQPRETVSQWIKDPDAIPESTLRHQVRHCIVNDSNYGPLAENIKHSIGHEYEFLLQEKIHHLGVPFLDEHSLRGRGYDKTPDFKLEIPIAVDGYVINWVESKASFGDDHTHSQYLEDQFWSYQNRFGAGAVVYWMGYISELDCHREQGIALFTSFPPQDRVKTLKPSI